MKFSFTPFAIALIVMVAACRKPVTEKPGHTGKPVLSIKLDQPYLTAANADSAIATWTTNGQEQRIRLTLRNDSLLADMNVFNEGNGQLVLHIFSNKKYSNQYFGQWVLKKTVSLKKNKTTAFAGPASFYDAAWFPRVELKDAIGHEAVIALRPDDPYFLVKKPNHDMYQYTVDRSYWKTIGGIAMAGRDIWRCTTGCADTPNEEFFKSLPGRIGTKPWNHLSIAVLFEINDGGEGWVLNLEHEP